jgi:hypothetical protein
MSASFDYKRGQTWNSRSCALVISIAVLGVLAMSHPTPRSGQLSFSKETSTAGQDLVSGNVAFDPEKHVLADLRNKLPAMQLHEGVNLIYTFENGARLSARVKNRKIVDYIATNNRGKPLRLTIFKKLKTETKDDRHEELLLRFNNRLDGRERARRAEFDKAVHRASVDALSWVLQCYVCAPDGCAWLAELW